MEPVRAALITAAQAILDQGGWCVLELCTDVPRQRWDAQVLIFDLSAEAVADAVAEEIRLEPEQDARISGCHRRTLQPNPGMGAYLCYLAEGGLRAPERNARELSLGGVAPGLGQHEVEELLHRWPHRANRRAQHEP